LSFFLSHPLLPVSSELRGPAEYLGLRSFLASTDREHVFKNVIMNIIDAFILLLFTSQKFNIRV
jgi:hypothetical protein